MSGLRDKPAYPTLGDQFMQTPDRGMQPKSAYGMDGEPGMTYREAAALHLMAGAAANPGSVEDPHVLAKWAVSGADALIAALEAPDATERKGGSAAVAPHQDGGSAQPPEQHFAFGVVARDDVQAAINDTRYSGESDAAAAKRLLDEGVEDWIPPHQGCEADYHAAVRRRLEQIAGGD